MKYFLAGFLLLIPSALLAADKRPNILFIMADDHAYQAIGAYGSKVNKTPHLDRLAKEGARFDRAFVTNSICGPCRAVILTGKYSHLNGYPTNSGAFDGSQQTVAKLLQKAGYQTAIIGKWHLVSDPTGFDHWEVLQGQGPYYNPGLKSATGVTRHEGYTTEIIADRTIKYLEEQRDPEKPFFLMCHHKAPHRNWQPGPKYLDHYKDVTIPEPETLFDDYSGRGHAARDQQMTVAEHLSPHDLKLAPQGGLTPAQKEVFEAAYAAENRAFQEAKPQGKDLVRWKFQRYAKDYLRCVDAVDDNVGRVLDYLDESGLAKDTVVIYTSDQGWYLGEHGWYDKRWMYEESFRTPLIVRWPGHVAPGTVNNDMVMNLDFAQTFLAIAGAPDPGDLQGASLVPVWEGKTPADWRKEVYYHYYELAEHRVHPHYGVRNERHKLIYFYDLDEWELYDLEKDPQELHSLYADPAYADIVKEMKASLDRLRTKYKDDTPSAEVKPSPAGKKKKKQAI